MKINLETHSYVDQLTSTETQCSNIVSLNKIQTATEGKSRLQCVCLQTIGEMSQWLNPLPL